MARSYSSKGYIKDIFLQIPSNGSRNRFDDKNEFIYNDRKALKEQFVDVLLNSARNGAYLVTGYPGGGKTDFVRQVINDYNLKLKKASNRRVKPIDVNFGKSDVNQSHLVKQIIWALKRNILLPFHHTLIKLTQPINIIYLAALFLIAILGIDFKINKGFLFDTVIKRINDKNYLVFCATISAALSYIILMSLRLAIRSLLSVKLYYLLEKLYVGLDAERVEETNEQGGMTVRSFNAIFSSKSSVKSPPIPSKEAEFQLIDILNTLNKRSGSKLFKVINWPFSKLSNYFRISDLVLVFKVVDEVASNTADGNVTRSQPIDYISSLKNLITKTNAKFIFVAGREMYDAYLAEHNNRRSPMANIFNKVIYVDSLLRYQGREQNASLSNGIECYLKHLLLPRKWLNIYDSLKINTKKSDEEAFLHLYFKFLQDKTFVKIEDDKTNEELISKEERVKIIVAMQHFITYLTWRSYGSPKKVAGLINDVLVSGMINEPEAEFRTTVQLVPRYNKAPAGTTVYYLRLSLKDQGRFGLITFLYQPLMLRFGLRVKNNSDRWQMAASYMMDHILKFHPFAFSTKHLELSAEVMSANGWDQLKDFRQELFQFLSTTVVRETEVKLFDHKFFRKVRNEIRYLAQGFEDESVAFSFTSDEHYAYKSHIRGRILELRSIYKEFPGGNNEVSISGLNNLLGDVRFFDRHYTDAITAYSDALKSLRNMNADEQHRIEVVILLIQLHLKIGLTHEKKEEYQSALVFYGGAMEEARRSALYYVDGGNEKAASCKVHVVDGSLEEFLQIATEAFKAKLFLLEKMSGEGLTIEKLDAAHRILHDMISGMPKKLSDSLPVAGFYRGIATLLFFKNMHVQQISGMLGKGVLTGLHVDELKDYLVQDDRRLGSDFKISNLGLLLNIKALNCLLDQCHKLLMSLPHCVSSAVPETAIIRALDLLFNKQLVQINDKSILNSIAVQLNCIGDTLLTNLEFDPARPGEDAPTLTAVINKQVRLYGRSMKEDKIGRVKKDRSFYDVPFLANGIRGNLLHRIQFVMICFFLSARYFSRAGKMAQCNTVLKQILGSLNFVTYIDRNDEENELVMAFLEEYIFAEIIRNISNNANSTDRLQIYTYKYYLQVNSYFHPPEYTRQIYGSLSNNPEIREAVLLFSELMLRSKPTRARDKLIELVDEQSLVSSENTIASKWLRVQELRLQVLINYKILTEHIQPLLQQLFYGNSNGTSLFEQWRRELFFAYSLLEDDQLTEVRKGQVSPELMDEILRSNSAGNVVRHRRLIEQLLSFYRVLRRALPIAQQDMNVIAQFIDLVSNSVYCLSYIVGQLQTYGYNYPGGLCFTADMFRYHAEWMQYYSLVQEMDHALWLDKDVQKKIASLIGEGTLRAAVPMSLYQQSALFYSRTLDLHQGGNLYKQRMQDRFFLEDDFNDTVAFFAAALERQRINSGNIPRNIERINKILGQSQLFKYESFVNDEPFTERPYISPRPEFWLWEFMRQNLSRLKNFYTKN